MEAKHVELTFRTLPLGYQAHFEVSQVLLPSDKAWGTSSCIHKPHFCVNPEGRPVEPLDAILTLRHNVIVSLFKGHHSTSRLVSKPRDILEP